MAHLKHEKAMASGRLLLSPTMGAFMHCDEGFFCNMGGTDFCLACQKSRCVGGILPSILGHSFVPRFLMCTYLECRGG